MLTSLTIAGLIGLAAALLAAVVACVALRREKRTHDPMQEPIGDAPHMDVDVSSVASAKEENWK